MADRLQENLFLEVCSRYDFPMIVAHWVFVLYFFSLDLYVLRFYWGIEQYCLLRVAIVFGKL